MGFLTGGTPPRTDLEIVLDFLFDAVEGWSAQFRNQEITRKMYDAAQALRRMKDGPVAESEPPSQQQGVKDGEEEGQAHEGREEDALRSVAQGKEARTSEAQRNAARERMAKARAARMEKIAARKSGKPQG